MDPQFFAGSEEGEGLPGLKDVLIYGIDGPHCGTGQMFHFETIP